MLESRIGMQLCGLVSVKHIDVSIVVLRDIGDCFPYRRRHVKAVDRLELLSDFRPVILPQPDPLLVFGK